MADGAADEFEALVDRCDRLLAGRIVYTRFDGAPLRGMVDAVFEADGVEDFDREVERFEEAAAGAISDWGWTFDHLERVDWYVPGTEPARKLALAVEALETHIALGNAYEWPDFSPTIDPDESRALDEAMKSRRLTYAKTEDAMSLGFIVGFSDELVLVHRVDREVFAANGYRAILRTEFLRLVTLEEESEFDEGEEHFAHAAVQTLGLEPVDPGAPLDSLGSFLRWSAEVGLVGVWERDSPDGRYVGAVLSVDDQTLIARGVDRTGDWVGEREHALEDIVGVDVLEGYLVALERVAGRAK